MRNSFFIVFIAFILMFSVNDTVAQESADRTLPAVKAQEAEKSHDGRRPNLFRLLGLSAEQVEQIRKLRSEGRPAMNDAQAKLREASRTLDRAIYADALDEGAVALLLEAQKTAQAEVSRLKYLSEMEVRKVLTPEQLAKFRDIRGRFERGRRAERGDAPVKIPHNSGKPISKPH